MIPTYVVIPVKDQLHLTHSLITQLHTYGGYEEIFIFDNGSGEETRTYLTRLAAHPHHRVRVFLRSNSTIYQMWNEGWLTALQAAAICNIAFLNNDIVICEDFLQTLAKALRSDPRLWCVYPNYHRRIAEGRDPALGVTYTEGTYRHGGMCGWAFMIKGEAHTLGGLPLIDNRFYWWCGDDDLAFQIQRRGYKIGRVNGLPVDHLGEASIPCHSELHRIKWEDMARFKAKYGDI